VATQADLALDAKIQEMAQDSYPETALLSQVPGVGTLTATVYVLTGEDPERLTSSANGSVAVAWFLEAREIKEMRRETIQNHSRHRPAFSWKVLWRAAVAV